MQYWKVTYTPETWRQFIEAEKEGRGATGFPENLWSQIETKMQRGDRCICFVSGDTSVGRPARFIAVLEVTGSVSRTAGQEVYGKSYPIGAPARIRVSVSLANGVDVKPILSDLRLMAGKDHRYWGTSFQHTLLRWDPRDGELVERLILEAAGQQAIAPIRPEVPVAGCSATAGRLNTSRGEFDELPDSVDNLAASRQFDQEPSVEPMHAASAIDVLAGFGEDMGLESIVRSGSKPERDLVWKSGNRTVAAFGLVTGHAVETVLLRLLDLLVEAGGSGMGVYVIGPRRLAATLASEVFRPAFTRASPPLADVLRFLPEEAIEELPDDPRVRRRIIPGILEEYSTPAGELPRPQGRS